MTNGSATDTLALISGSGRMYGVLVSGGAGTVVNWGSITASFDSAVTLADGGTVINGSTADTTAAIGAQYRDGVQISGAAGTIVNYGRIHSEYSGGVGLAAAGIVINGSASDTSASISGDLYATGVDISGGQWNSS